MSFYPEILQKFTVPLYKLLGPINLQYFNLLIFFRHIYKNKSVTQNNQNLQTPQVVYFNDSKIGCLFGKELLLSGGNPLATTGDVLQRWKKKSSTLKSRNKNINLDFSDEEDMDAGYVINVKPNDDLCDDNDGHSHTKETWSVSISRDQEGNKLVNEYIILKTLGSGSYGKVKLCMNNLDLKFFAIKICHKGVLRRRRIGMSTALQDVVREIAIMKKLDHKNVVKLYEIINDSEHEKIYMVMEYISGGPILKLSDKSPSEPLPLDIVRSYFRDIICGVEYLHKQKIIHRDIKPENLLVTVDGIVKITDFSVSHVFVNEDDTLSRSAGSPAFLAPELCTAGAVVAGKPVDLWACGVSLYALIYGRVPFTADNLLDIYEAIRNDEVKFLPEIPIPDDLKDLLLQILDKNPSTRIKIPAIKKHSWVTDNGAFQFPDKIETIEVSPSEVQNAITNNFMALVRFKSRMSQLSNMAKKNIKERCSQINFGGSPLSLSDISDSDSTSSASASESSYQNKHQEPESELSVPVTDAEMREFTQNNPDFLQFQPL